MPIGEVARRAGVSVQTLRHYDRLGLLVPIRVAGSGYRYYTPADCARLELIRTLRSVGIDLGTIGRLLEDHKEVRDTLKLHLEALETQVRCLKRQQVLLKATLEGNEDAMLARLGRLEVLARLGRRERENFLAEQLGWDPNDSQGSRAVWEAAVLDMPEAMNDRQLEAWLELAELVADPSFRISLERQLGLLSGVDEAEQGAWFEISRELMTRAVQAVEDGEPMDGEVALKIAERWVQGLAAALGEAPDAAFVGKILHHLETTSDPRFARYWHLVAILKGWPYDDSHARASRWLAGSLRHFRSLIGARAKRAR